MLVCFGTPVSGGNEGDKKEVCYCAILLNGKIRLAVDGKQVYTDIKLSLERKITTDGVLIYPDGSKYFLKNGECINHAGELIETDSKKNKPDTNTRKI